MTRNDAESCPICKLQESVRVGRIANMDACQVACPRCGRFLISGTFSAVIRGLTDEDKKLLPYLSAYTRQESESQSKDIRLDTSNWRDLARIHESTHASAKQEKLLRLIEFRSSSPGSTVKITANIDYPLIDACSADEMEYFLDGLERDNLIDAAREQLHVWHTSITIGGWDHLERIRSSETMVSKRSFEIAAIFQKALKTRELGELDEISFEDLTIAKAELYPDFRDPYYQLLEQKFKEKERAKDIKGTTINIEGSFSGVLNTGEMESIGSISTNLTYLNEAGHVEVADAIKNVVTAVGQSDLPQAQKDQAVELLDTLSTQAALPEKDRLKAGPIKAWIDSLGNILSAGGGLAGIWTTWGPAIKSFFGIE